jgi:hypothetical protein
MMRRLAILLVLSCPCLAVAAVCAAEVADKPLPDKSGYNLFRPVPKEILRDLSPDRPDRTESPYTVDAGRFQVEWSFAEYTSSRADDVRTDTWNIAPVNFKVGLFHNTDLQLVFADYLAVRAKDRASGTTTSQSGFGDLTMRLKINLWGNDGGRTALAILPLVKFPTGADRLGNDSVEGGVILPFAAELPAGWDMGAQTGILFLRDADDKGRHNEFVNSITFGRDLFGKVGGYVEFFTDISTERGSGWIGTADFGLTYRFTEDMQADCGVNLGVTRAADDVNAFAGMTVRF